MIKVGLDLSTKQVLLLFICSILFFLIVCNHLVTSDGHMSRINPQLKSKAEITMLVSAVRIYEDHFEDFPKLNSGIFDFGEHMSKVPVNDPKWKGKRPMFIDYIKNRFEVSNDEYDDLNAKETIVYDPFGSPYHYKFIKFSLDKGNSFEIISAGEDQVFGTADDINSAKF